MIIVTGTSSGIGLEVAKFLISKGVQVTGVSRRNTPISDKLFTHFKGDITDSDTQLKFTKSVESQTIDAIVFNHGVLEPVSRIEDSDVNAWKRAMDVNFFSVVSLTNLLIEPLRAAKARVIFVSSGAAVGHYSTWGSYGATKAALNHFAATLATEEPDLISVSVAPGVVDTDMQKNIRETHSKVMNPKDAEKFIELHKNGNLISPETSGKLYGNLALSAAKELSGQFLRWYDSSDALKPYVS